MQLGEFRQQYPQYNAWSDADLAEALYQKYYSDRDKGAFYSAFGVPLVGAGPQPQPEPEEETGWLEGLYDSAGDVMAGIASSFITMPVSAVKGTGAVFGADLEGGFVSDLSETEWDIQRFFGGDPSTVPYKLGSALGSMGAFIATSVLSTLAAPATGGASLAGIGAAGASLLTRLAPAAVKYGPRFAMAMGAGASEQADRLRALGDELGDVDEIDRRLSLAGGFTVGSLELLPVRLPIGIILSKLKKGNSALEKEYVRSMIRAAQIGGAEGLQEAGASVLQNAIAKGFYDPDLDLTESAAESFGYGAAAGGIFQTALELMLPRAGRRTRTRRRTKEQEDAAAAEAAPAEAVPEAVAPVEEAPEVVAARTVLGGADQAAAEAAEQAAVASVAPEKASEVSLIIERARKDFVDFGGAGSRNHDDVREAIRGNFGEEQAAIYAAEVDRLVKQAVDARLSAEAVAVPPEPTQPTLPGFEDMRLEFASEEVIGEDVDGTEVATRIVSDFSEFLPIALDKGAISLDDTGTPDVYRVAEDEQGRSFVESNNGIKVSPYLSTKEQAETVRWEMNARVPEILQRIDEAETEVLAREAAAQARQSERGAVLSAARAISSPAALPTVDFGDLDDMTRVRINQRRMNTGRMELAERDSISIEEISDSGLSEDAIADLLPDSVVEYTANDVIARVQERGYRTDDEGFRRWARRGAGGSDLNRMTGAQLQQLAVEAEKLPEFPVVEGRLLPLPVVRRPEVSALRYATAVNTARSMPARPKRNLAEGEIFKSDINEAIGVKGGVSESIIQEAIRRGDLVRSKRKKNVLVAREKVPEADVEIAEEAAIEVDEFGQMELPQLKVRLSEAGSSPATRAAATADFKATIEQAVVDARIKQSFPNLGGREGLVKDFTARMNEVFKRKGAEVDQIAINIVDTLEGKREGEFDAEKMVIAIALDALPADVKNDMTARRLLREVVDHEAIHALKVLGLFSDADWQILTSFVRKTQRIEKRTRTPGETFYVDAEKNYTEIYKEEGLSGKELEEAIVEEAVAEAFRDFGAGELGDLKIIINGKEQGFTGKPASLFKRIVDFFRKLRGSLDKMGIRNAYDVFSELRETQRYRRPAPTGPPAAAGPARERRSDLPLDELRPEAEAAAPRAPLPVRAAVRRLGTDSASVQVAPDEVKGSTLGADEDAEWKKLKPFRTKDGKIRGAPSWVKTSGDMVRLRKRIVQLVKEGISGRFWYEDSARTALEIAGGDLADAERFIGLLAIYSPQSGVFANTGFAIKAFTQWENGEPVNVKTSDQDGKAQRWLDRGEDWGGRKTNSFYLNIMHDIVNNASQEELAQLNLPPELLQEVKRATVDLWVLRALGYDVDQAGTQDRGSGKYSFSENELRRMASVLNGELNAGDRRWLPHQVQAALWSAIKGRAEIPSVKDKTNAQSLKRGFATIGKNGKISPPQSLGPARAGHMKLWLRNALQASPQDVAKSIESARGSFKDMVERIAQNVTWEAIPSAKLDTAMHGASLLDQRDFTEEAVELLLDEGGIDLLAKMLGVSLGSLRNSTGAYEVKIGPNVITGLVPIKPKGVFDNRLAYAYARAIQYIFRQDAVPIFRADPTIKFNNSYKIVSPKTGKTVRAVGTYGEAVDILQEYIQREAEKEARVERVEARKKATAERAGKPYKRKSYSPVRYFVRGDDAAQGIQFVFHDPLTKGQERQFFSALKKAYGRDVGYTKMSPDRIALINYRSGEMDVVPWDGTRVAENIPSLMPDDRFLSLTAGFDPQQGGAVADTLGIKEVTTFGAIGEYGPVHDWAADPDGKELLDERSETRRPDLQDWIRDRRKAAEDLTARYDRAERNKRRGRREDPRADRPGRAAGLGEARVSPEQQEDQSLPGIEPRAFGFNPEIEEVARTYAERAGIPYVRQAEYVPVDPEFSARIATAYDEMVHDPSDPAVQRAYRAMIDETLAQYQVMKEMGYTVEMMREGMDDPYGGMPRRALEDLSVNKHLWVFPTDFGFGPDASAALDPATNPLLEFTEEVDVTGRPMRANDVFRAVHDFFGHGIEGTAFRGRGEENAWQAHSRLYSREALPAVTSETRGQNSWINYGPYSERNRGAKVEETVFADQKTGLMPSWTWTENVAEDMVERPIRRYSVRRPRGGRLGFQVESPQARERRRVERERAAAPSFEEAKRIRDVMRSGTVQPGDYRGRLADDALHPIYVAPTPLVWGGEDHSVVIEKGYNEWDDLKQAYNGFGIRHANEHLPEIQQNTQFNSVESFVEGMLDAYRSSRNTREAGNFDLRESGRDIVLQWNNPDWGVPGKLVLREKPYNRYKKLVAANPNLVDKTFLGLTTAFTASTEEGSVKPRIMPQINPASSNAAKRAAGKAKPNERVSQKLRKKYSVNRGLDEHYTPEQKKLHEQHFDVGREETFFEKIMQGLGLNSNDSSSFFNIRDRFRTAVVDARHPLGKAEKQLQKLGLIDEIMADSSTGAMLSLLTRASGVVAAGVTKAPIIYSRGMFVATDPKALDHWHDDIAQARLEEIWEMIRRTAYIDPITGEDVSWESPENVRGLVDILQGMDNAGLLPQFFAYAGAMRAKRLIKENREKLFTEETIAEFEKLADGFPEIRRAYQEYQLWNNALVNLMTDTGVISEQMGELWKTNADYLPFYREFYNDEGVEYQVLSVKGDPLRDTLFERLENRDNNKFFPSSYNVKQPKELKGGKPVYRVMVNNVADTAGSYTTRDGDILKRAETLAELNPNAIITIITGSQRVQDPLSTVLMNASAAITSSMANVAMSRGIRDLRLLGDTMARPISDEEAPTDPHANRIGIRVNGETKWYWVGDRMLVDALAATNDVSMSSLGLQALPAQLLRELVTKDPGFMAANMLRDTLTSWTTSGVDVMPVVGTLRGYGEALMGTVSARALEGMGVYGGYDFKGDPQNVKKSFEAHMKRGRKVRARDLPGRIWYGWDKIAGASDLSTRIAVYNSVLEATGNEAQAALEALEVINFSRKGASSVIRYLTAVVPFMNARIQGLDVLYRGSKGEVSSWGKQARRKNFYFRAATIVALTAAYHLYHSQSDEEDDPWYHNAPEYIKDNYWIIPPTWVGMSKNSPAIRLPIPFEVGVLFKVIPERIMSLIDGSSDGRETWDSLGRHTFSTLNFNPIPQWALPVVEGVFNHSIHRGEPILSYWDQKNEGWLADPEYASPFAIMLSESVDKQGGRISAQKIDHVFRGYVGTLGSYALMAADSAGRIAAGIPERPTKRLDQWPVLGRFLQEHEGRGPIQTFYDLYEELDIFNTTLNNLKRREDFRGEDYYRTSRANLEMHAEQIKILKTQLDGLRTFKKQIQWDTEASPASKRRALDGVAKLSNEILSGIKDLRTKSLTRQ